MAKVEGSNPFIRFRRDHRRFGGGPDRKRSTHHRMAVLEVAVRALLRRRAPHMASFGSAAEARLPGCMKTRWLAAPASEEGRLSPDHQLLGAYPRIGIGQA
jgi:hypothetical protein